MTSFFKKKDPLLSTISLPTKVNSTADKSLPRLQEHVIEPQELPMQSNGPWLPSPLSVLSNIASNLPNTIPLAAPSDSIAMLTGNPEEIVSNWLLEDPDEDPYGWLDKSLNGLCSKYAKEEGLLPLAIWRGRMGFTGLWIVHQS